MADKFTVAVKFSYHTLAEIEDDDLGMEVLNLIRVKRGTTVPKTADQILIEQLQARLDKQETDNYQLKSQLEKLTKALTAQTPPAAPAPL